ncbi:hypothetical protein [Streptomyces sp. NPDC001194]
MSAAPAQEPARAARPSRMIQHSGKERRGGANPPAVATTAHHERQYP